MKKYQLWYKIFDTLEEAKEEVKEYNKTATAWQKKKYPGHIRLWTCTTYCGDDGIDVEQKYIAFTSR